MVQNIDVAPTLLEAAGGDSFECTENGWALLLALVTGSEVACREHVLYEHHWDWNFAATPTTFAIRTDRWKFISRMAFGIGTDGTTCIRIRWNGTI
jgi:N-acetylglucosamine-6-sulfatase